MHEEKRCPRCSNAFECKVGTIAQCQCSAIQLSVEESAFIQAKYEECLCINCLHELKEKYVHFKSRYFQK